ncbi:glutaminase [Sulfurospirillum arcachonense]|uniref:glutaminase n=1 Tax=Sulfurospirillum arcachonense TaxID=57666 RepID=UPI000468EA3C|nr:glutaminase [Sulfurospirillum arcachonense]
MNYEETLKEIQEEVTPLFGKGKIANYIPALAKVEPNQFAMSLQLFDGQSYHVGNSDQKFSIQSISKVFTFTHVMNLYNESLENRLGLEPSGDPFNSLVQLEYENGKPRNPFINAGAIVLSDMLVSKYKKNTYEEMLKYIQKTCDNNLISIDEEVYLSERKSGFKNYSMIYMMKSFKNIKNDINNVMEVYFKLCSLRMSTNELSRAMLFLSNHGVDPITQEVFLTQSQAKRVNAVMLTCGHYDASGDFAFRVGLPAKSGVGGGIVAVIPGKMSLCVYSPRLNSQGNSLIGTKALELFTTKTGFSIF